MRTSNRESSPIIQRPFSLDSIQNKDHRGLLSAYELTQVTGVKFERYFIVSNIVGGHRGGHAHKYTHQVIDCIAGSFVLDTIYLGCNYRFKLDTESHPVFTPALTWVDMNEISNNCSILVLSSDSYSMANSLRSYEEYNTYCQSISS